MPEFVAPDLWIKGGLLSPAHRKAMGVSVWLYLYILSLVRFDGPDAGRTPKDKPYRHTDAAEAMGVDVRSIKREFEHLQDAGYITPTRTQYGLHVTVNKYVAVSERARKRTARSDGNAISEQAPEVTLLSTRSDTSVHQKWRSCPPEVTETPLIYKEDKSTSDSREQGETRVRALTPLQLVVNAWMEANGRDPSKAKDYGRFTAVGGEIAERGDAPQDVRGCTIYLWSDPWRRERMRRPSLEDVRDALPQWKEQGRPGNFRTLPRQQPTRIHAGPEAVREARRIEQEQRGGYDFDRAGGGVGMREVRASVPGQLPDSRHGS